MRQVFSNNAQGFLQVAITSTTQTEIFLQPGQGNNFYPLQVGEFEVATLSDRDPQTLFEIVHIVERNGDRLIIERNKEASGAKTWAAGTLLSGRLTKGTLERIVFDANKIVTADGKVLVDNNGNVVVGL